MKKFFTLSLLGLVLASSLQAQTWDWGEEIAALNPEIVDSVKSIGVPEDQQRWLQSCMIYYHQPLQHDNPSLGTVPLRALLTVIVEGQYKDKVVQMSIGGYDLDQTLVDYPNVNYDAQSNTSLAEIAAYNSGHVLRPEHRFFGTSCPEKPMENIQYCEAKEAAADFHALAEAVKKVFNGKWVISGVSKGGIATAIQHAYYPDDADCFIPYVAPILTSANDLRVQERSMTEPWTPQMREQTRHILTEMLNRPAVYDWFEKDMALGPEKDAECRCQFLAAAYDLLASAQQTRSRAGVSDLLAGNQKYLQDHGLEDYTDMMLACMIKKSTLELLENYLLDFETNSWNKVNQAATRASEDVKLPNFQNDKTGYYYQAVHELGYYDFKWDYFYDTQAKIDSVNTLWQSNVPNLMALKNGDYFGTIDYNPALMDLVRQQTASTTKPLLYIYGGDDFWTGGRMPDEYINGDNVRLYILPEQNHDACISRITDKKKQEEIWSFLDAILKNNADAIEQINQPAAGAKTRYNLMGQPTDEAQGLSIENGRVVFKK